eukprot:NODE_32876_length_328_cov_38.661692.p3 GENE.NODE_32876_length_328_cov_38.661692~~NODE_32876_length_328_cov_38.661692.p3  ORF type:complete len:66 (+),score=16.21 NODE_32876_length_328_cov_38.661692:127-324(+)
MSHIFVLPVLQETRQLQHRASTACVQLTLACTAVSNIGLAAKKKKKKKIHLSLKNISTTQPKKSL